MRRPDLLLPLILAVSLHAQQPDPSSQPPVTTEFRVFDGWHEVTAQARLRVMPSGERDKAVTVEPRRKLVAALAPGIYDAQAFHTRQGSVIGIKWAERLVVMHYPDEGGRHLEVINVKSGFGALQLRAAKRPISAYEVAVFASGERERPAGRQVAAEDYLLFVLRAGRYDIRVQHAGTTNPEDIRWFLDVEVPADRTRLKKIDVAG
jgi:hypothetical protein